MEAGTLPLEKILENPDENVLQKSCCSTDNSWYRNVLSITGLPASGPDLKTSCATKPCETTKTPTHFQNYPSRRYNFVGGLGVGVTLLKFW